MSNILCHLQTRMLEHDRMAEQDWALQQRQAEALRNHEVVVLCKNARFCLKLYSAPDGHQDKQMPNLQPGETFRIYGIATSSNGCRVCAQLNTNHWVNILVKYNLRGDFRPQWYVRRTKPQPERPKRA